MINLAETSGTSPPIVSYKRRRSHKSAVTIFHGNCLSIIPSLADGSISAAITSPPYALQRATTYGGISEADYPQWAVRWANALKPKLTDGGSLIVNLQAHIRNGLLADYVMRTRLALRSAGWIEHDTIYWHKPDAPPLGRKDWPRRSVEEIYWFSLSSKPYVDCRSLRIESENIGMTGSNRFGIIDGTSSKRKGIARDSNFIVATVAGIARGIDHPAMYPASLAEQLIRRFSRSRDTILDPFAGSGTTGVAAKKLGRKFVGIEVQADYVEIIRQRLA
jgi:site-specific DNA-methyltransferase (adenine-specific)